MINRNRFHYLILILLSIAMGLLSWSNLTPQWFYPYIGDVIYAFMFFFIIGFLIPKKGALRVAIIAALCCYLIELLQLYQADWINIIRSSKLGALVLGQGFLWSDLLCYTIGAFLGYLFEFYLLKRVSFLNAFKFLRS